MEPDNTQYRSQVRASADKESSLINPSITKSYFEGAKSKQGIESRLPPIVKGTSQTENLLKVLQQDSNSRSHLGSESQSSEAAKKLLRQKRRQTIAIKNSRSSVFSSQLLGSDESKPESTPGPKKAMTKRGSINLGLKKGTTFYSRQRSIQKTQRGQKKSEEQSFKKQTTFAKVMSYLKKKKKKRSAKFLEYGKKFKFDPKSLYLFDQNSKIRQYIVKIVENKWFDRFILFIIFVNSITMVSYDYSDKQNLTRNNQICELMQDAFTYVFAIEALLKIIEQGFWKHKNAYLRDGWNWIDFIVAVLGLVELFLATVFTNLPSLGPVRMLRAFRPLKSINSIPSMRRLILTLITSLPALANVVLFLLFVFILFGILGVHSFAGLNYYRCRLTPEPVGVKWEIDPLQSSVCSSEGTGEYKCRADTYCGAPQDFGFNPINFDKVRQDYEIGNGYTSFDNLGSAIFTIFQVITLEGWTTVMYNIQDHSHPWLSFIYFFLLVVFGSFFILNYFLAVFMDSFSRADEIVKDEKKEEIDSSDSEKDEFSPQLGSFRSMRRFGVPTPGKKDKVFTFQTPLSQTPQTSKLLQLHKVASMEDEKYNTRKTQGMLGLANEEIKEESSFESHNFSEAEEEMKKKESSASYQYSKFSKNSGLPHKEPLQENFSSTAKQVSRISKRASSVVSSQINLPLAKIGEGQESPLNISNNISQVDLLPEVKPTQPTPDPQETARKKAEEKKYGCWKRLTGYCFQICDSTGFSIIVFSCILANTILLSLDKYPISRSQVEEMELTNQIFSAIFLLEMIVKLLGMGPKMYFNDKFNQFDCSIVVVSTIDTTLTYSFPNVESGNLGRAITIFRGFRLLRIFKLARSWKSFQVMLINIRETLKDIANFSILLGIVTFIYTLVGMELFSYTYEENQERQKPRLNFDYFSNALVSVIIVLIGEDWDKLMIDTMVDQKYPIAAAIYFVSLVIIGSMILLNLFLAILLKNFEDKATVTKQVNKEVSGLTVYLDKAKKKTLDLLSKIVGRTTTQQVEQEPDYFGKQTLNQTMPKVIENKRDSSKQETSIQLKQEEEGEIQRSYQAKMNQRRMQRFLTRGRYGEGAFGKLMQLMKDLKEQQQNTEEPSHAGSKQNSEPMTPLREQKSPNLAEIKPSPIKDKTMSNKSEAGDQPGPQVSKPPKIHRLNKAQSDLNSVKLSSLEKGNNLSKSVGGKLKQLVQMQSSSYQNLLNGKALYLFSPESKIRKKIARVVFHKYFDNSILTLIMASSILLIAENPLNDPESKETKIYTRLDIYITSIFTLEFVLKAITFGFMFNGKNSYMRSGWNNLDLFTVIISWISIGFTNLDLNAIKVLRVLRVLRPLKMIARNESLKLQIHSLLLSIPGIVNVLILSGIFYLLFGIFFTNFFKGTFFYCVQAYEDEVSNFPKPLKTKWDCLDRGGTWINQKNNFDSTVDSFITLFIMTTTEGWIQFMLQGADATAIDYQPVEDSQSWTRIFFVLFTLFGCLFLLNLFMEVVVSTFQKEKEKLHRNYKLTESMREWLSIQIMCLAVVPKKQIQTESKVRKLAIKVTNSDKFEKAIILCILANTLLLGIYWVNIEEKILDVIEILNIFFASIFTLEAIFKIFALRKHYFEEGWNIFDFTIVLGSWIAYFMSSALGIKIGSQTTIVRSFRIGRILRLMRKAKQLKAIFNTLIVTFPSLANVGALLLLFIYIYSVLGMNLFAQVMLQSALNRHANFQSFTRSFMTLIRASTGEAWYELMNNAGQQKYLMYQCTEEPTYEEYKEAGEKALGCGDSMIAYLYFISFMMVIAFIFLNLFIAVILQGFNETSEQVNMFLSSTEIEQYQDSWMQIEPEGNKLTKLENLDVLIKKLAKKGSPLVPFPEVILNNPEDLELLIESLELPLYHQNSSYNFTDILVSLAQNQYKETYVEQNLAKIQAECLERYQVEVKDYDELIFLMNEISMKENIQLCKRFQALSLRQIKRSEKEQDDVMGINLDSKIYMKIVRLQRVIRNWITDRKELQQQLEDQQRNEAELYQTDQSVSKESMNVPQDKEEKKQEATQNYVHSTMINERTFDQMVNPPLQSNFMQKEQNSSVEVQEDEILDSMSHSAGEEEEKKQEPPSFVLAGGRPEFDESKTSQRPIRQSEDFTQSVQETSRVQLFKPPSSSNQEANIVSYDSEDQEASRQNSNQPQILNLKQKKLDNSMIRQNKNIMNKNTPFSNHLFPYEVEQQKRNAKIGKEGLDLLNSIIDEDPREEIRKADQEVKKLTESQFFHSFVSQERPRNQVAFKSQVTTRRNKEDLEQEEEVKGIKNESSSLISHFYSRSSLGKVFSPLKKGTTVGGGGTKREEDQESEGIQSRTTSKKCRLMNQRNSGLPEDFSPIQSSQNSRVGSLMLQKGTTKAQVTNKFSQKHSLYSFEKDWNNINSRYGDISINKQLQKDIHKGPENFSQAKSSFPGRISFDSRKNSGVKDLKQQKRDLELPGGTSMHQL